MANDFDRLSSVYELAKWQERKQGDNPLYRNVYATLKARRLDLIDELLKQREGKPHDIMNVSESLMDVYRDSLREKGKEFGRVEEEQARNMFLADRHAANQAITAQGLGITVADMEKRAANERASQPDTETVVSSRSQHQLQR